MTTRAAPRACSPMRCEALPMHWRMFLRRTKAMAEPSPSPRDRTSTMRSIPRTCGRSPATNSAGCSMTPISCTRSSRDWPTPTRSSTRARAMPLWAEDRSTTGRRSTAGGNSPRRDRFRSPGLATRCRVGRHLGDGVHHSRPRVSLDRIADLSIELGQFHRRHDKWERSPWLTEIRRAELAATNRSSPHNSVHRHHSMTLGQRSWRKVLNWSGTYGRSSRCSRTRNWRSSPLIRSTRLRRDTEIDRGRLGLIVRAAQMADQAARAAAERGSRTGSVPQLELFYGLLRQNALQAPATPSTEELKAAARQSIDSEVIAPAGRSRGFSRSSVEQARQRRSAGARAGRAGLFGRRSGDNPSQ